MVAMRERNAGIRGTAVRRRDAGNDRESDTRPRKRLELLAAAAEHERIAALQPHHAAARAGVLDEQLVDRLLGRAGAARPPCPRRFVRRRAARRSSTPLGTRRSCRMTSASCRARSAFKVRSSGSPGSGAHQRHVSRRGARCGDRGQQPLCDALRPRARRRRRIGARRRSIDERLEIAPPRIRARGSAAGSAARMLASHGAELADARGKQRFEALPQAPRQAPGRCRRSTPRRAPGSRSMMAGTMTRDASRSSTTFTGIARASAARDPAIRPRAATWRRSRGARPPDPRARIREGEVRAHRQPRAAPAPARPAARRG